MSVKEPQSVSGSKWGFSTIVVVCFLSHILSMIIFLQSWSNFSDKHVHTVVLLCVLRLLLHASVIVGQRQMVPPCASCPLIMHFLTACFLQCSRCSAVERDISQLSAFSSSSWCIFTTVYMKVVTATWPSGFLFSSCSLSLIFVSFSKPERVSNGCYPILFIDIKTF